MIINPNSCGQSYDPDHKNCVLYNTLTACGYGYSHTTMVTGRDGVKRPYDTWLRGDHAISIKQRPAFEISAHKLGSSRHYQFKGLLNIFRYLKRKARCTTKS